MAERELSQNEVEALGLEPRAPQERELSSEEVSKLGLEKPEAPGVLETMGRAADPTGLLPELIASAKTKGKGKVVPYEVSGTTQYRYEPSPEEAEERKAQYERTAAGSEEHPAAYYGTLLASMFGPKAGSAALRKVVPTLRGLESAKAIEVMERLSKPAAQAVREATSSLGGTTARGSGIIKTLGGQLDEALAPSEIAANKAALASSSGGELASKIAEGARADLPTQLQKIGTKKDELQNAKALLDKMQEYGITREAAAEALKGHMVGQAKRYGIPLALGVGGAAYNAVSGEEDKPLSRMIKDAAEGGVLGLAARPTLRALLKNFGRPDTQRLMLGKVGDVAEGMIKLGSQTGGVPAQVAQKLIVAGKNPTAMARLNSLLEGDQNARALARRAALEKNQEGGRP